MAIEKAGIDTFTQATSNVFSWDHVLVAGTNRLIVVDAGGETTLADQSPVWDATSITYAGIEMTRAAHAATTETAAGNSNNSSELWYILESDLPSDGTHTIVIYGVNATSPVELFGVCSQYTGVYQGPPEDIGEAFENTPVVDDTIENNISPSVGALIRSAYV